MCCLLAIESEFASAYILGFILEAIPGMASGYQENISSYLRNDSSTILLVVLLAPLFEEFVFRFFILGLSQKLLPFLAANLMQAALFGIYHLNLIKGIYAFVFGLLMGYLVKCTGSIISSVCFHITFNLTGLMLDDYMPRDLGVAVKIFILAASLAAFAYTFVNLIKVSRYESECSM